MCIEISVVRKRGKLNLEQLAFNAMLEMQSADGLALDTKRKEKREKRTENRESGAFFLADGNILSVFSI